LAIVEVRSGNFRASELTQFVNRHETRAASLELRGRASKVRRCARLHTSASAQILRGD
jgi:hypothetical protein